MISFSRKTALAFGLVVAGGLSFAGSSARAQYRQPPAPTYYLAPPRATVPVVPRYAAPTSYRNFGFFNPVRDGRGAAYTPHYGYSPARRDLKLYKPWLSRD